MSRTTQKWTWNAQPIVSMATLERADGVSFGYLLGNTVTENGHVARGACTENATHELLRVVEYTHIEKDGDGARFTENGGKAGHICLSKQLF